MSIEVMGFAFGENAYKQFVIKGIVVNLHWVNHEPAMCLFPARKRMSGGVFVAPLNVVYDYVLSSGAPTPRLVEAAKVAARQMGMDDSDFTVSAIASAIHTCVKDLIEMPPEPDSIIDRHYGAPIGEAIIKVDGTTIYHDEVTVPEGMH